MGITFGGIGDEQDIPTSEVIPIPGGGISAQFGGISLFPVHLPKSGKTIQTIL
jgi:hypothetical protein